MKTIAIIQARMGSTRLPKKVLQSICGKPMLWHIVNRARCCEKLDEIIIATSDEECDDEIEHFAKEYQIPCFRGNQNDVLDRFWKCANKYEGEIVVRLTGDNALIDPRIINEALSKFSEDDTLDYLYYRDGLPIGMATEVMKFSALTKAYYEAKDKECREHVTPYLYRNEDMFRCVRFGVMGEDYSNLRWTMDTEEDRKLILDIYKVLYKDGNVFGYEDILGEYNCHPEWKNLNSEIKQVQVKYQGEYQY